MERKKAVIIYNPASGKGRFLRYKKSIEEIFRQSDYELELYKTVCEKDATQAAINYANKSYDLIVASGGDGTLHEVINGLMECTNKPELGYIPSGTTNDFAKSVGLPMNPLSAAKTILKGKTMDIDIGQINEVYFVYVTAFGTFTPISYQTPTKTKAELGYLAYLLNAKTELKKITSYTIKVSVDDDKDQKQKFETLTTLVVNSTSVAGIPKLLPDAKINDGLFDLLLFEVTSKKKIVNLFSFVIRMLSGFRKQNTEKPKVNHGIRHLIGSKFTIQTAQEVTWNVDGEKGPTTSLANIEIHKHAIRLRIN